MLGLLVVEEEEEEDDDDDDDDVTPEVEADPREADVALEEEDAGTAVERGAPSTLWSYLTILDFVSSDSA